MYDWTLTKVTFWHNICQLQLAAAVSSYSGDMLSPVGLESSCHDILFKQHNYNG